VTFSSLCGEHLADQIRPVGSSSLRSTSQKTHLPGAKGWAGIVDAPSRCETLESQKDAELDQSSIIGRRYVLCLEECCIQQKSLPMIAVQLNLQLNNPSSSSIVHAQSFRTWKVRLLCLGRCVCYKVAAPGFSNAVPSFPDKTVSLGHDLVRLLEEIAPHASRFDQFGKCSPESFNG
jgi:hypothetical protein